VLVVFGLYLVNDQKIKIAAMRRQATRRRKP
jgi:hypothetical protein